MRVGQLDRDPGDLGGVARPGRDRRGQRLPVDQLHHQEGLLVLGVADAGVQDRDEAVVAEVGQGAGLGDEAGPVGGVVGAVAQHLDRDVAGEQPVLGAVDVGGAAPTQDRPRT